MTFDKSSFFQIIHDKLYLDYSRKDFVNIVFDSLKYLIDAFDSQNLANLNFSLEGERGVGKTFFLKTILHAIDNIFPEKVITIYHHVNKPTNLIKLLTENIGMVGKEDMVSIECSQIMNGKIIFLVLDDIHTILNNPKPSENFLQDLTQISASNRIICVTAASKEINPEYTGKKQYNFETMMTLKHRFTSHRIYPFFERKDFENVVKNCLQIVGCADFFDYQVANVFEGQQNLPAQQTITSQPSLKQTEIDKMYLKTEGNPRLIRNILLTNSTGSSRKLSTNKLSGTNKLSPEKYAILSKIFEIKESNYESSLHLESKIEHEHEFQIYYSTIAIEYNTLIEELKDISVDKVIYELIDSGHVYLKRNLNDSVQIGFVSPIVYFYFKNTLLNEIRQLTI